MIDAITVLLAIAVFGVFAFGYACGCSDMIKGERKAKERRESVSR